MKNEIIRSLTGLALVLTLAACNQSEDQTADDSPDGVTHAKVYLDEAQLEQLAPYASACQAGKRCVEICHVPPGNPKAAHTKTLPLQSMCAHLNHGGPIADHDYVGPCHDGDDGADDGGDVASDDGGSDVVNDGDIGTTDVPAWCVPYLDIDSNCDGIIDGTQDPLL